MQFSTTLFVSFFAALLFSTCSTQPSSDAIYKTLKEGEAVLIVTMDDDPFYPTDSRFTGEVTISPNTIHMNLFDQFESNVIVSINAEQLFTQHPIKHTIDVDHQSTGSVMIGRVRDKKLRMGDGFLMTAGDVTIEALSDEKLVVRLSGKTGNYTTLRDAQTWKKLEGLLVYKRPTIVMRGGATKALLY